MSNAFPPPNGQPIDYASVVPVHRSPRPNRRWRRTAALWALIGVPVLGVGAIAAVSNRTTGDDHRTVAAAAASPSVAITTMSAETGPLSTVPMVVPTTISSTNPPTAAPTVPPT